MYTYIDGNLAISVNDWKNAGLTYRQFRDDSQNAKLQIAQRGINGNTLIFVDSIKRPERMRAIEAALGAVPTKATDTLYTLSIDTDARAYFATYTKADGTALAPDKVIEYTIKASLFTTMKAGLMCQMAARAANGTRVKMTEWYADMLKWHTQRCFEKGGLAEGTTPYSNVRGIERAFKRYCNEGYASVVHGGNGGDNARKVNARTENLFLAIWRGNDKPFVNRVHELYNEFLTGITEIFDKETGEVFKPNEIDADGNRIFQEVSEATVWNYLKDIVNSTAVDADRNGNFAYANKLRPKNHRKHGQFSMSKISMDDVVLSRKSSKGWVTKYIAVDVVSGYIFRPAYVVGKPTHQTVYETFRNMFCELTELNLPMPGELEVEYHLMKDLAWLQSAFPFVRFCNSPTEKRVEHTNRQFKYGTSKKRGHTRGRWYAKHEAYSSIRYKEDGDYVEPTYDARNIIADDIADIERYNNEPHPLKKTYPGMSRKEVMLKNGNPHLKQIEPSFLYQYIGNETKTSIRNNDYCACANAEFELMDYNSLNRLKPNSRAVTAYWLPKEDGSIDKVYLYQDSTYIGEAINREQFAYNECAVERTDDDRANMLHQQKRTAKFDKFIRDRRKEIGKAGMIETETAQAVASVPKEIVLIENDPIKGYEEDEFNCNDYAKMAINNL